MDASHPTGESQGRPSHGSEPDTHRPPRRPLQALLSGWLVPAVLSLAVLSVVGPALLLSPTTPDLGGQLHPLARAVQGLPQDGLPAWSAGWFGGFPLYHFTPPLPALLAWAASLVMPLALALRAVSVAGVALLPFAAYVLARGVGFGRPVSVATAVGGAVASLWPESAVAGFTLEASLAGHFGYALGFSLSLIYLGIVARTARGRPGLGLLAALALAGTALCHLLPAAVVVAASLPLLTIRRSRRPVLASWVVGFLLAGFWAVPFLLRVGLLPLLPVEGTLAVGALLSWRGWLLAPLALAGAALTFGKRWAAVPLLLPPLLGGAFLAVAPPPVHPARLLSYGIFALHILAAVFTGGALLRFRRDRSRMALGAGLLGLGAFVALVAGAPYGALRSEAREALGGYEARADWDRLSAVLEAVRELPPGRVHWERAVDGSAPGGPGAGAALPYFSPDHPVTGGTWTGVSMAAAAFAGGPAAGGGEDPVDTPPPAEGVTTAPDAAQESAAPEAALDRLVPWMRVLGTRYFVAFSPATVQAALERDDLDLRIPEPDFQVFEVDPTPVEVALATPRVHRGPGFARAALAWAGGPRALGTWLVADGPEGWPRVPSVAERAGPDTAEGAAADPGAPAGPGGDPPGAPEGEEGRVVEARALRGGVTGDPGPVSDVRLSAREISFTTSALGVPHRVKASWFPNWRAEGALGPYLTAPGQMVVIPNRERVRLRFRRGWAEWLGLMASALGAFLFVSGALHRGVTWAFLSARRPAASQDPESPEA